MAEQNMVEPWDRRYSHPGTSPIATFPRRYAIKGSEWGWCKIKDVCQTLASFSGMWGNKLVLTPLELLRSFAALATTCHRSMGRMPIHANTAGAMDDLFPVIFYALEDGATINFIAGDVMLFGEPEAIKTFLISEGFVRDIFDVVKRGGRRVKKSEQDSELQAYQDEFLYFTISRDRRGKIYFS